MKIEKIEAAPECPLERIYIMAGIVKLFKGKKNVEIQIIRPFAKPEELAELKAEALVAAPGPELPEELVQNSSIEKALRCILEAFTDEESKLVSDYLEKRYGDKFELLQICPVDLPVPFGVAPLAEIPESDSSGFIRFENASDYALDFPVWGYYDLAAQTSSSGS